MTPSAAGSRSARHGNRRDELVEAAAAVFARNGVAATTVDDVVREAGVAKGTFYLYFTTKDEVVTAVADRLVVVVGAAMERSLAAVGRSAADRLQGIALAMTTVGERPYERELIEMIHRPENQAIHDRLGGRIVAALRPAVAAVIADGIRDGEFAPQDPDQGPGHGEEEEIATQHREQDPAGQG